MGALLAALQVDVPARPVRDVTLLEFDRVRVDDVLGNVDHLFVMREKWNDHAAIAGFRHELAVVLDVVDAGRNDADTNDTVLAVIVRVVSDGERQLQ